MRVEAVDVAVYSVPLERPQSDGTHTWDRTVVVVVEPTARGVRGLGFTYATAACATLIDDTLADVVVGRDPLDVPGAWGAMVAAIRNMGRPGICSMAIAAVDAALWDLKARLLDVPLADLLGRSRDELPMYASGGFTSMSEEELRRWAARRVHEDGIGRVKIKIAMGWGACEDRDLARIALVREAIGPDAELYVDANGGFARKQAIRVARRFQAHDVRWFEEPVSSDDLEGMREVRDAVEAEVASGEYGYDAAYFVRMIPVVDVLQVDASRCAGITEWLRVAAMAGAHGLDVSTHTAQSLHAQAATSVANLRHLEYFEDHARADRLLFDGVLEPSGGVVRPDRERPGLGLELKRADAERFRTA